MVGSQKSGGVWFEVERIQWSFQIGVINQRIPIRDLEVDTSYSSFFPTGRTRTITLSLSERMENWKTSLRLGVLSLGRAASRRFLTQIGQWSYGRIAKVGTLDDTSKAFPH